MGCRLGKVVGVSVAAAGAVSGEAGVGAGTVGAAVGTTAVGGSNGVADHAAAGEALAGAVGTTTARPVGVALAPPIRAPACHHSHPANTHSIAARATPPIKTIRRLRARVS